jgi:extracellular elastinolytic metalloproteinase
MKKLFLLSFLIPFFAFSQSKEQIIEDFLSQNLEKLSLKKEDVKNFIIHNQNYSKSTKTHNIYITQKVNSIEIFNAVSVFAIDQNNIVRVSNIGFIPEINKKTNSVTPVLNPEQAIFKALQHLSLKENFELILIENKGENHFIYKANAISQVEIPVKLVYQPNADKSKLNLAWDLSIYLLDSSHWYSIRVDAVTGEILSKIDWVSHCSFDHSNDENILFKHKIFGKKIILSNTKSNFSPNDGSNYYVLPIPNETPNHGSISLISQPANALASPYGWHDTNGIIGTEFTTTRGNNVRARADLQGNNTGNEVEGGTSLNFNFAYNFSSHPNNYLNATTTNLFYWNNINHDVFHFYGFDEASGNFQLKNYTNQGLGNDFVNADDQDGSGTNNANFATPPDGFNPRMQMYNWSANTGNLNIPSGTLADNYVVLPSLFGGNFLTPVSGNFALLIDNNGGTTTDPNDACDPITNGANLNGKIVVIKRGNCEFGAKVLAAQNAGAIAVIVVNNAATGTTAMSPGSLGASVTIPSVMINQSQGNLMINELNNGGTIIGTISQGTNNLFSSSMDSGVIIHEYGHGISIRLTGGSSNSNCLVNEDQMGEGWSDYFALMLTMKSTDTANQGRGIGTYLRNQPTTGGGIRPAPYSRNFAINNYTYASTNNTTTISRPHGIGFIWATMLWDMTWDMIDVYGFNPNIYNGTGGNNKALQLVVDGLKLQPCSPGFVDGRDAILQADLLANNGVNKCLIWRAFAKRGLGLSAAQGNSDDRTDQVEAFDLPSDCALSYDKFNSGELMIYPNPSNGEIFVLSKMTIDNCTFSIIDTNGRLIKKQKTNLSNYNTINIENLNSGFYILKIKGEGLDFTTKIIKN